MSTWPDRSSIEDVYPLSPMQQGMLFHTIYSPDSGVYVEQVACTLRGDLNPEAFRRAWEYVVSRHTVLRTSFAWRKVEKMLQVVHRAAEVPFLSEDWRSLSREEQEDRLGSYLTADRKKGFDLRQPPLIRLALFRLGDDEYRLVWTNHHLLVDGWSLPLLLREVFLSYEALRAGRSPALEEVPPFRDYITWLQKQDMYGAEEFWRQYLEGFRYPTPARLDRSNPGKKNGEQPKELLELDAELTERLGELARRHGLTLSTVVQGAWAIALSRYSGEEDVVFGVTVSGRPADLQGVDRMIGLFINTLPLRVGVYSNSPAIELLKQIQMDHAKIRHYEYTPLVQIQTASEVNGGSSLFESILVFENYPVDAAVDRGLSGVEISDVQTFSKTNYPLTLVAASRGVLSLGISYDQSKYSQRAVVEILGHLEALLRQIAAEPERPVSALKLLDDAREREMLVAWSGDSQPQELESPLVHQLVDLQAQRRPDAVALVHGDERLTYAELRQRSNQLAQYLRKLGVGPDRLVGLSMDRSIEMVVAILGVWKAGGAYVPVDPSYPRERVQFMFEDSSVSIVLTQDRHSGEVGVEGAETVRIDADWERIARESDADAGVTLTCRNLAYMIYTSGSTGRPKGVLVEHRGLVNLISQQQADMQVGESSRILQFASLSFDASLSEISMALTSGATLLVVGKDVAMFSEELHKFLQDQAISHITLPPSMLAILSEEGLPDLRAVISAGESCSWEVGRKWSKGRIFYNGYGPTEVTVGSSWYRVGERVEGTSTVPVGRPIPNCKMYLVDRWLNPVPVGVPGEICIGGVGVARGYHARTGLTAERFVPDPFCGESGARMYRTGDLASYLEDGTFEFLGRVDHQVKVRGFRIELGEIEACLVEHPDVRDAVVDVREDRSGEKQLVGYVVPTGSVTPDSGLLFEYLQKQLPDHMVPAAYVVLEALPLSPNGKVDRRALPAPGQDRLGGMREFQPPRTPTEEIIAGIWSSVLGIDRIGVHDDFFALGGHSLKATQVAARIRDAFSKDVPLQYVFENRTLAGLSRAVESLRDAERGLPTPPLQPVPRGGDLPLSFAQQRLWFLDRLEPGSPMYNIPVSLRVTGPFDVAVFEQSLTEVVSRHEILRTTFRTENGSLLQVIEAKRGVKVPVLDLSARGYSEQERELSLMARKESRTPFDLEKGPLFRVNVVRLSQEEHVLFLTMHHIISDEWSALVLIRELSSLYEDFRQGKPSSLPALALQYADYAHWQREFLQGEVLEKEIGYWREQLRGTPPILEIPTDRPRPSVQTFRGASVTRPISADLRDAVAEVSGQEGVTPFMTFLAGFYAMLYRYSGQEDISIGSPIANRTQTASESLIGFFVNTLVLRADLSEDPTFRELLRQVREICLGAYAHQDVPFEKLVEELQPDRDLSHSPLFQVAFVYQPQPLNTIAIDGLTLTPLATENGSAKFDLTLTVHAQESGLLASLEYNSDIFDSSTAERMLQHYETLLKGLVGEPDGRVSLLALLSDGETDKLLRRWNKTEGSYPDSICIHTWFEEVVQRQPQALAVVSETESLTYQELNSRANQVARYLRRRGVGPEMLVGVCMERCADMIVGILGILKSGGAFVPLDPGYPPERLAFMCEDARLTALLVQHGTCDRVPAQTGNALNVDLERMNFEQEDDTNLEPVGVPENLAYVIFTSGSTGKPKGAMLQHRGVCNLATAQIEAFGVGSGNRILQFSSLSFDASVWEIVMALLSGSTLCLASREKLLAGDGLLEVLRDLRVNTVTLPPSVLAALPEEQLQDLRTIIAAGERCSRELVQRWADSRAFFNAYGPTESTVCASMHRCDPEQLSEPPIGRPILNTRIYLLDTHLEPVPVGVVGELHVGGVGLARGYLGRADLTAERFIPDSFSGGQGARLYKTGDLARFLPDGNIEFLGRIDDQVKVRGFRIELGEIEAVLGLHPAVRDVVVVVREDMPGDKRIVAYLVPRAEQSPAVGELRKFVRDQLPEFMVPSSFVFLEAMPLMPNGKVDRRTLPAPERTRDEVENVYVAPRNETEERLADISAKLLGVEKVGVHDDFFELGGHSLLATQLISRLRQEFDVEVPLRAIFTAPTVAGLADKIGEMKQERQGSLAVISEKLGNIERLSQSEVEALLEKHEKKVSG